MPLTSFVNHPDKIYVMDKFVDEQVGVGGSSVTRDPGGYDKLLWHRRGIERGVHLHPDLQSLQTLYALSESQRVATCAADLELSQLGFDCFLSGTCDLGLHALVGIITS